MFFHEYPCAEILDLVVLAGYQGLEFWVETPDFWLNERPVDALLAALREYDPPLSLTVHAPVLDLNPCSINPSVTEVSIVAVEDAIALAGEIGAPLVTVHPGRRTAKRPPSGKDFERFTTYLTRLERALHGSEVTVAIENMERATNSLLSSPRDVAKVLGEYCWLSFTLDVSHALVVSLGEVEEFIEVSLGRLANVHLGAARNGTVHLPVSGDASVAATVEMLTRTGYRGPLTLEIEDQHFRSDLSAEEKVTLLIREREFLEKFL
jgi:sugar phosphate isomerase/epimerase